MGNTIHPGSISCTTAPRAHVTDAGRRAGTLMLILALLVGLSWAREAAAQTNGGGAISLNVNANGVRRSGTPFSQARPWWINRADCVSNQVLTFAPSLTDISMPLEIWVGSDDCAARRGDDDRGQCWIVAREQSPDDRPTLTVPMRNVVARLRGSTLPPTELPPVSVCDQSTDPGGEPLTFYLMLVQGGQAESWITWTGDAEGTGFDTLGPAPPGAIDVGVGERQLSVSLDDVNDSEDLERFEAFCVPAGTDGPPPVVPSVTATTGDAGTGTTSDGSSSPAPADCFSPIIAEGARPPDGYSCGLVGKETSTILTDELVNETVYAVAVSGQDVHGNAGVVSDIQCGTPTELNDFFEVYNQNGGPGGGGFCNLSPSSTGGSRQPVAWLGLLFGGLLWRRVRSRV